MMSSEQAATADRHHNEPPLAERLALDHADALAPIEALLEQGRALPKDIDDDEALAEFVPVITRGRALNKSLDALRDATKRPHLDAGRTIDAFFKAEMAKIDKMLQVLNARQTKYLQEKAARERREREEEARRVREAQEAAMREAERLDAENRRAEADQVIDEAQQLEIDARVAEKAAQAKPAEMARTYSTSGMATLRTVWKFEITDRPRISPAQLWPYFTAAEIEKAIGAAVRNGVRDLDGIRIYEDSVAQTR